MILDTSKKVLEWLSSYNAESAIKVIPIDFTASKEWVFTAKKETLRHHTGGFFSVTGLQYRSRFHNNQVFHQPIIHQPEIGILGFLATIINGELYLLAQAKIEPGNVNTIQLGPTLQATESNYRGIHGGTIPRFLNYFTNTKSYTVLVDQLQSEQGSRFYKKRNRNMVVLLPDNYTNEESIHHKWISYTLWKELLGLNYIVNTDSRSVIASLVFSHFKLITATFCNSDFSTEAQKSLTASDELSLLPIPLILDLSQKLKLHYSFESTFLPLSQLNDWEIIDKSIVSTSGNYFSVEQFQVHCQLREVADWDQPLINTFEDGFLGLICKNINGVLHILLQAKHEPANFDTLEFTATVHRSIAAYELEEVYYTDILNSPSSRLVVEGYESEEGGRFYQDKNKYKIVYLNDNHEIQLRSNYCWFTLSQIGYFIRFNNFFTNELRSLLALMSSKF